MKLDYKKTIKVGFAFAIIMIFWAAYDFVVPLLLERAFGLSNTLRGLIMGLDNLLSLFLLPIFGKISDRSKSRFGRRTPFIVVGTVVTVALMVFVPISANKQLKEATEFKAEIIQELDAGDWEEIYKEADKMYLSNNNITKAKFIEIGQKGELEIKSKGLFNKTYYDADGNKLSEEQYKPILEQNDNYAKFCASPLNSWLSKQVYKQITLQNVVRLVIYMIILFFVLVAMATFRSPAVALMPDVTPKPLRSPANAIINLMGGVGAALAFIIYTVGFFISDAPYIGIFACVGGGMLLLLAVFLLLVNENKFVRECEQICAEYGIDNDEDAIKKADGTEIGIEDQKERKAKMISFFLILASIFMWFMGYNAVSSNLSVYTTKTLNLEPSIASVISGISMGISAIAFIPVGYLAAKIGRRKSIMLGFIFAALSFVLIWLLVKPNKLAQYLFTLFYLIAGFGLIIANVNTFPMVVELSRAEDVGKYTGYYYVATMSAQAVTPFVGGLFMDAFGDVYLFTYSAACVVIATLLMFFVKHGDSRPVKKSKLEMLGDVED
ncbi:MAG TPA: SLC45 family MFS transporter [Clostridiales bacterium]|nr:SLC45 family MFS transporter [Clostridiales bacterium]